MLILPFKGTFAITQIFNDKRYRESYAKFGLMGHNGIDYATPVGTPIYAPIDGVAKETDYFDQYGYGNYIKIQNDKEGVVLAHFKDRSPIKPGTTIKQGDLVGYSGNSGNSTGPHLHMSYWREPRNRENGFNGFLDHTYWLNIQVGDAYKQKYDDLLKDHGRALNYLNDLIKSTKDIKNIAEEALE